MRGWRHVLTSTALAVLLLGTSAVSAHAASITGTVFEDVAYGGGAGRDLATAAGVPRSGARVELYSGSGTATYVNAFTTDGSGQFQVSGLAAGAYVVRVVNTSVSSSRAGYVAGTHLAVQTFRTDVSTGTPVPVTDHVGGEIPALADAPNGKGGVKINTATAVFTNGISGTAQSITIVTVGSADISGVDFGYSFDVIVNTNASGQGSLRQFLINANALSDAGLAQQGGLAGIDNAVFMLADGTARPGLNAGYPSLFTAGMATIAPTSALPTITSPVVLDARTQPGWSAAPLVELDGTNAGAVSGITVTGGGSTIAGFVLNRWRFRGIDVSGGGGNTIVSNRIGTNAAGTSALANLNDGILVTDSPDNVIGGPTPIERNLISGNRWVGIQIKGATSTGNRILGNFIGVDATGSSALPNLNDGIDLSNSSSNTTVGGTEPGAGNVISGHTSSNMDGIWISDSNGNVVQGNRIGTDSSGTSPIRNDRSGVYILNANGNLIGGSAPGAANTIAYNDSSGVLVLGSSTGNAIIGNRIFANTYLGVDLNSDGVTPNDGAKSASQPNAGMDYPVIAGAVLRGGVLDVSGWVGSAPGQSLFSGARVELFLAQADASGHGEGRIPLGMVGTDSTGAFGGSLSVSGISPGDVVTATATDGAGNTSEFSANVTVTGASTGMAFWRSGTSTTPESNPWDGAKFGTASKTVAVGAYRHMRGARALTRDEAIVLGVTDGNDVSGMMWNGSLWSALPFNNLANNLSESYYFSFAVSYESQSGDAVVVWRNGTSGTTPLSYRVWNGSTWSNESTITSPVSGDPTHIYLVSDPYSDEMVLVAGSRASEHYALVWDGANWGNAQVLASGLLDDINVAYEQQSGAALVVYGKGDTDVYYRTWNGSAWSAEGSVAKPTDSSGNVYRLVVGAGVGTDRIAMAAVTTGNSIWLNVWNGTSWDTSQTATTTDTGSNRDGVGVAIESRSGRALAAYGETGTNSVRYRTWNETDKWSSELTGPDVGDQTNTIVLESDPGSDDIMLMVQDDGSDLNYVLWNGFAWGTASELETDTNEIKNRPLAFVWNLTAITLQEADLAVSKGVDNSRPNEGDTITYFVKLTNLGPDPVTAVTVDDSLPAGLEYIQGAPSQGSYIPSSGAWSVGGLAFGATATLDLVARVSDGTGGTMISNVATIAPGAPDPVVSNNTASASITVQSADLALSVSVDDSKPNEGQALNYVVTLRNQGPDDATGIVVTNRLPDGLSFMFASPPAYDSVTGVWTVGNLAAGDSTTLAIRARVNPGTGGQTLADSVSVTAADQADPDPGDGQASVAVTVQSADLVLGFSAVDSLPEEGASLALGIAVLNAGPDPATGVIVADSLPAGLTFVSATPQRGTYDPIAHRWTIPNLPADSSASLGLLVTVEPATAGSTLASHAWIASADQADPDVANNDRTVAVVPIVPGSADYADLAVTKTVDRSTPNVGDTLTYQVTASNRGPAPVTGLEVTDVLPDGLLFVSAMTGSGAYDAASGVWNIGGMGAGASAVLTLRAVVDTATGGRSIVNTATASGMTQRDTIATNDRDSVLVRIQSADLSVEKTADIDRPFARDSVTYDIRVKNAGPDAATGVRVRDVLPAGVLHGSSTATVGTYDPGSGVWNIAAVAAGSEALLSVRVAVDTLSGAREVTNVATIEASDQEDPIPGNDHDVATITIQTADLSVAQSADRLLPHEGESVVFTIAVANAGPDSATGVFVVDDLPARLAFQSATAPGAYDSGTGRWTVGTLEPGSADTLRITATVQGGPDATPIINEAAVAARDQVDPDRSNDAASVVLQIPGLVTARALSQSGAILPPADPPVEVLRLALANRSALPETLDTVTLTNTSVGPGTMAELDAEWQPLALSVERIAGGTAAGVEAGTATFTNGGAAFEGLDLALAPGDSVHLVFRGGASVAARDGDALDLELADPADLVFRHAVELTGTWPLAPSGSFPVDGMTAAQIDVKDDGSGAVLSGSRRNVVLSIGVPSNGYVADVLNRLNVKNEGNAEPVNDIERVEAWTDADADGSYDPDRDTLIGEMSFTGDRWELTGLTVPVPVPGILMFVTCDLAVTANEGRTLHFVVPAQPDVGIGMQSANDGPVDVEVPAPGTWTISTVDRVTMTPAPISPGTVTPGQRDVPLLHLVAGNSYATSKTLASLVVTNTTTGPGSPAQRDGEISQLTLRIDGDADGQLGDVATDPPAGTAYFSGGYATFTGLSVDIPPGGRVALFVTGDASLQRAADGDALAARIEDAEAVGFTGGVTIATTWPIDSGARWTVDGMVADQIVASETPTATIGPNEGPVLAWDALLPRNGYADDQLREVKLENSGSALPADLAAVRLWRDGGNGMFDAGAGDDLDLGPMVWLGGQWVSQPLATPLGEGGARIFASIVSSAAPATGATVRLGLPVSGVSVASGNDGPLDEAIPNPNAVTISTAALLTGITCVPSVSTIGQTVTVQMNVRNAGDSTIASIAPSSLILSGDGGMSPLSGPVPGTINLAPGAEGTFAWTFRADSAGAVRLSGSASGIESGTGLVRQSLETASNTHRVFRQADGIALFPIQSMPFSINRGQDRVVPLSLTWTNPGGADASDVLLRGLTVRLEDSDGAGVVPATLLSGVAVNEGTNIYLNKTTLESAGSTIDLSLSTPALIPSADQAAGQVTLSLSLTVLDSTTVPSFRVVIDDQGAFRAEDATSGAPITVELDGGHTYPIRSGLARVVAEATRLDVAGISGTARTVGQGQAGVSLLELELTNPGPAGLGSDVRVSAIAVTLRDSTGLAVIEPTRTLEHITVQAGAQTLVDRDVRADEDSILSLAFTSTLNVPVDTPVRLTVSGRIADAAEPGSFRVRLADSTRTVVREANIGTVLPALYASVPIEGPTTCVRLRADSLRAARVPRLPASLPAGAQGVAAMTLLLEHPGGTWSGTIRCDSLSLRCRGQAGEPLIAASFIDKVRVRQDGVQIGELLGIPASQPGLTVPLTGCTLSPGATAPIEIEVDFEASAPVSAFELVADAEGIHAFDANLGSPVTVAPRSGAEFPLSSGLTQIVTPSRELAVGFSSLMPAVLAADGALIPVADVVLRNAAVPGSGPVVVDHIHLRAADVNLTTMPFGRMIRRVQAYIADSLWADSGDLPDTIGVFTLTGSGPLEVHSLQPVTVEVRIAMRSGASGHGVRIGCDAAGIGVVQSENPLLGVVVVPEEGRSFPYWTEVGNVSSGSLDGSYSNFPNPFAAGREDTRFAFYLRQPGRVTLRIWTARGERVRTVLDGAGFGPGMSQSASWDGRNGVGDLVTNGVYIAEINVAYDDGTHEQLRRKVAVAR